MLSPAEKESLALRADADGGDVRVRQAVRHMWPVSDELKPQ
jgi:hypothetical protein